MRKVVKLRWDADLSVEPTVTLEGKPCVDLCQPDVFLDHKQTSMSPTEARRLAKALIVAAEAAERKLKREGV